MSDIFLSYASPDKERARWLAEALQQHGWTVFWDLTIPPGKTWRQVIGSQLEAARCVVVAWSQVSIERHWVLEEAEVGLERGMLVPLLLDAIKPPLGFRSIQAADFREWQGDAGAAVFKQLVEAVAEKIGSSEKVPREEIAPIRAGNIPKAKFRRRAMPSVQPGPIIASPANPATDPGPLPAMPESGFFPILRHPLRDGGLGPEMVLIPAGQFRMGDLDGSGDLNEEPVHRVRIARPFHMGRYAVTFDEYDLFAQAKGIKLPDDAGWGRGNRPVINVSWKDAVAYCLWLAEQTGQPYRLPSESEWEYAARAGRDAAYWWGKLAGKNWANFDGSGSQWSNKQTAPVGSFPPNPWGLYDTAGNAWEWAQDRWHDSYQGAPEDGSVWATGSSPSRVLRGGSWFNDGSHVRSAYRHRDVPAYRAQHIGFRLALGPIDPA